MRLTNTKIEEVLRAADIEALIQLGAPKDEYEPEARSLIYAISHLGENELTEERLTEIIRIEWTKWFGPFSDEEVEMRMPDFRQIAHQILALDA